MKNASRTLIVGVLAIATVAVFSLTGCAAPGADAGNDGASTGSNSVPHGIVDVGTHNQGIMVGLQGTFTPESITVHVGDAVTFVNRDKVAHHIVIDDTDLGNQAPLQKVTWTAEKVGTFTMKCTLHPSMVGRVAVLPAGGSSGK